MRKTTFFFAGIISAVIGTAYATGENTVTSKSYVDTQDALKQDKIPISGTNSATPGSTVVTYTGTAGTIGERGIYDGSTELYGGDFNDITTISGVYNVIMDLGGTNVVQKQCANPPTCTLWELVDVRALGTTDFCNSDDDCGIQPVTNIQLRCINHYCDIPH